MALRVGVSTASLSSAAPTLTLGARGSEVVKLQKALLAAGGSPGAADGIYGPKTDAAVRVFQRTHGLSVDGIVGPKTWAALGKANSHPAPAPGQSPTLRQGASGAAVTQAQQLLTRAGFSPGTIDGRFGPRTLGAVRSFQRAHGLLADGVVGPKTWAALRGAFQPRPSPAPSPGSHPTLREGAHGAAVTQLQNLLGKAGIRVGVDGAFGPQTLSGVERFQYSRGLDVDGVVGPQTWSALVSGKGPVSRPPPSSNSELRQRILDVARSQLGKHEATNHNDGEIVKYPRAFGRGSESWCADFVSWVNTQAGNRLDYAYCPYLENHLKATGQWKGRNDPMAGDIVLYDWNNDGVADHVGIVESVNRDGSVNTIEGNTTHSSNGEEGVWRKTRYPYQIIGYGNPA